MSKYAAAMAAALFLAIIPLPGQTEDNPRDRAKAARELARGGSESITQLSAMVTDPAPEVRLEAVKSIVTIGTQHSIDPLIQATKDNDPEIQIRAVDGIVNFYLPGYLQSGLQRMGSALKSRFEKENTQVIDPYVTVREDAVVAIGRLASGGSSMESRANAARAAGILRGKAAIPDLLQALTSKNSPLMFESLIALQKIGDTTAGPRAQFLLRDLEERIQVAAIETAGLLRNQQAVPDLQRIFSQSRSDKVRRAALSALAMLPAPENKPLYERSLTDGDEDVRAAAAEGIGRLKDPANRPLVEKAFGDESKMKARLAAAFAVVALGNRDAGQFSALPYLIDTLNSKSYRGIVEAYLTELARNAEVRGVLHARLNRATKEEKLGIGRVLSISGDKESVKRLEALTKDQDEEVMQESIRAVRSLRSRLP